MFLWCEPLSCNVIHIDGKNMWALRWGTEAAELSALLLKKEGVGNNERTHGEVSFTRFVADTKEIAKILNSRL